MLVNMTCTKSGDHVLERWLWYPRRSKLANFDCCDNLQTDDRLTRRRIIISGVEFERPSVASVNNMTRRQKCWWDSRYECGSRWVHVGPKMEPDERNHGNRKPFFGTSVDYLQSKKCNLKEYTNVLCCQVTCSIVSRYCCIQDKSSI